MRPRAERRAKDGRYNSVSRACLELTLLGRPRWPEDRGAQRTVRPSSSRVQEHGVLGGR